MIDILQNMLALRRELDAEQQWQDAELFCLLCPGYQSRFDFDRDCVVVHSSAYAEMESAGPLPRWLKQNRYIGERDVLVMKNPLPNPLARPYVVFPPS